MKSRRNRAFVTPSALWLNAGKLSPMVAAAAVLGMSSLARAQLPQNGQTVNGQATVSQNGNYMGIVASNGAIINWQSFNIGAGQTVQFFQPSADSRVLNRITGPDPSRIAGSLISNGIVYISNPAGVFFAHGALVDVGGIYAAGGSITNSDFINNVNHFTGLTGAVENKGTINAGAAHLIGQRVANYGTINAPNGMVTMAAGDDVFIGEQNGQVFARVSGGAGDVGVTQAGQINAAGGRVVLGAGDMYAMAIDHPGSTKAKEIHLEGGRTGVVSVSGTLDASNQGAGGTGGKIEVLGDKVGVFDGHLNASGDNGGGTILLGGDRQGQGDARHSDAVYVSAGSTINADANVNGNGGKVIVWSDRFTNFQGKISAKGGSQGGDGGFIETSGKKDLYMTGSADASASHGKAGQWLLDPTDVTLSNAATSGGSLGSGVFTPGNNNSANVNLGQITAALAGGTSVTINTNSSGGGFGDITLVDPLSVTLTSGGATLTLNAVRDIFINNTITGAGTPGNELGLTFNAGRDVSLNSVINLNGGAFQINASGLVRVSAAVNTGGGAFSVVNTGPTELGANIDAGTGDLTLSSVVMLTSNVVLSGHNLTFNGTVDSDGVSARNLVLNSSNNGVTKFNANVGAAADLGTITTNADGTTELNAQFLKGTTVTLNDPFQVDVDGVVRGLTSVTFNSTIASEASEANDLQVNSPLTTFNGTVGAAAGTQLGLFQTNDVGSTTINTGVINADRVNFKDAVTLGVSTVVTGTTSVAFGSTIDSESNEANGLTIASPVVSLVGNIGQGNPGPGTAGWLGLLRTTLPGTTTISGALISCVGIDLQSDVVLGSNCSMFGSLMNFGGKIDSAASAGNSLTLSGQQLRFGGDIGTGLRGTLGTLTTSSSTPVLLDGVTISAAAVDFRGNVTVGANSIVRGTTSVNFGGVIDSQAGELNWLTLGGGGAMSIVGNVGQGANGYLGVLRTEAGGTLTLSSSLISTSWIDFQSGLVLAADLTTFGNLLTFAGPVNSLNHSAHNLSINADSATISGSVGQGALGALGTLTTGAGTTMTLSGAQMLAGAYDFRGAVLAGGNTALTSTGNVNFRSTINSVSGGAFSLTVTGISVFFGGDVGTTAGGELGTLIVGPGTSVVFDGSTMIAGGLTFGGALTLNHDTTLTGSASVIFSDRVDSAANQFNDLLVNSPSTFFAGRVGERDSTSSLGTLRTNIAGTTTISTNSITADTIDFQDAVVLSASTTLHAATSVTFGGTLDSVAAGGFGLTVNSPATTFSGQVGNAGSGTALGSVSTDSAGFTTINTDVFKAATIDFADVVVIGTDTAITGTTSVRFELAVNSEANEANDLTVNSPDTTFEGVVGGGANGALGALVTDAPGTTTYAQAVTAASISAGDTVNINGGTVTTTGNQTYDWQVFLGADTTLEGHDIAFNLSLNSGLTDRTLTINTVGSGTTRFNGPVGSINPLKSLTTNVDGQTIFSGAQIITGGDQTYNDLVVVDLTTNISAANVTFVQTVNSSATPHSLIINTSGNGITTFSAAVGDVSPLLQLTTNADGTTKINGGAITTTSTQTFNDATVLGANTVLSGGGVAFGGTLNSDFTARTLTVNTLDNGVTTFSGAVGSANPLASLTTNADGTTKILGGTVRTTGDQTYNDALTAGDSTTLTANDVTFGAAATFGTSANLTIRDMTAAGALSLGNNARVSGRTLTANGAVTLDGTSTFTGSTVTFNSTIDSATASSGALVVNTSSSGVTTFGGNVGGVKALKSLTTNADGTTRIGANITTGTGGSQSYGDQVRIFRNSVLTDGGGTGIAFASTIDSEGSPHSLSLLTNNAANGTLSSPSIATISFGGNVGASNPLFQLRIGGNRTTVPNEATIVAGLTSSGAVIPNFAISFNTTGAFAMGTFQKMTVLGSVAINAGGAVAVSDISALGNIWVSGPSIAIRTRPGGEYLRFVNGALSVGMDVGTDFVAGGEINFTVAPTLIGGFNTANFATPFSNGISSTLFGFAQRSLGGAVSAQQMHFGTAYLDLAANGPSNTNLAFAIADDLPSAGRLKEVSLEKLIGKSEREQLGELGIATRSAETSQLLDLLLGRAMVSDVNDSAGQVSSNYTVTVNRLPAVIVRRVLATYQDIFGKPSIDPQSGKATASPQADRVGAALSAAYAEYSAAAGAKADALGFRAFLESVPAQAEALNYLNGLHDLFAQLGYLGLTPTENRIARNRILQSVPVKGLSPAQVETVITAKHLGGVS